MISHISIKDFAIIEDVQIDFHEGLNLITGETGAGKSICTSSIIAKSLMLMCDIIFYSL